MAQIDLRNPPNEFPDIVGTKSENPILASFRPFIPARAQLRELTPLPLMIGTMLGMVFGASSLYLVLKVGLTVSASIPVAVISITIFRLLSKFGLRDSTVLENNIVQTAGSAGESIAFGLGVTMPAIMILGFDLEITRVMLVATLGGLIGILMMIPLRRALIGVGYVIGPRISSLMMAGGVLSYLVLIPAIKYFGSAGTLPLAPETAHSIADMSIEQIQKGYILYIGAGAVAAAGIISLFRSIPLIWHGLKGGLEDLRRSGAVRENVPRTDQDLSMKWVLGGI